jgi:ribonuclease J
LKKLRLRFFGGVGEVGGNKILLTYDDEKIFFDFGLSFSRKRMFYSEPFLSPRSEISLMEFGLLPKIKGVYRFESESAEVSAVFISHAHMDHSAYISFLKREIPVYCGETSAIILSALDEIRKSFEYDFSGLKFKVFRTGSKIRIGDVEVKPVHVDHSIPGAYAFLAYTPEGVVAYTGDFRLHGSRPEMTWDFVGEASKAEPEAFISEGTNLVEGEVCSEAELTENLSKLIEGIEGLVLADFSPTDVDRLKSFLLVAERTGKKLTLNLKHAYLLEKLSSDPKLRLPSLKDDRLLIYRKAKKKYARWEKNILDRYETVGSRELASMQKKVILALSFYSFSELFDIKPAPGSCYILSSSEPVGEEAEIDYERMLNWLEHYGLPQYHIHVSGHIMPLQLLKVLEEAKPKKVFPIHTERPALLKKFVERKFRVETPVVNREYKV